MSFDLWMSKGAYNVFALVINFLSSDWQPKHVTIGLFEATKTTRNLTKLLDKYGLKKKIIAYVKDEGSSFNATIALKVIINYEPLGLEENFLGTCFGHAFSKACQYGIIEEKVCKDLKYAFIKST
jgi:hypothetical protein